MRVKHLVTFRMGRSKKESPKMEKTARTRSEKSSEAETRNPAREWAKTESGEERPDIGQLPPHPKGNRLAARKRKAAEGTSTAAPPPKQSKGSENIGDDVARGEETATPATDPSNFPQATTASTLTPSSVTPETASTPAATPNPLDALAGRNTAPRAPSQEPAGVSGSTGVRPLQLALLRGRRPPKKSSVPSSSASLGERDVSQIPAPEAATTSGALELTAPVNRAPEPGSGSVATALETPPPAPAAPIPDVEKAMTKAPTKKPSVHPAGAGTGKAPKETEPAPSSAGAADSSGKASDDGAIVVPKLKAKLVISELIEDPMLTNKTRNEMSRTFKELYEFTKTLMDRSAEKSAHLKECEDGLTRLQEKDRQLSAEIQKRLDLRNDFNALQERTTREIWLLKNDIQNLEKDKADLVEKSKEISKAHKDDVERLQKVIADTDVQFAEALQRVKTMAEEKAAMQQELEDFKAAAQAVIELVEAPTAGGVETGSLLEKLRATPQKVANYISEATRAYITQALALVKSYWPKASLEVLGDGMAANCSVEQFNQFCEEVEPVAKKIAESLEQDG